MTRVFIDADRKQKILFVAMDNISAASTGVGASESLSTFIQGVPESSESRWIFLVKFGVEIASKNVKALIIATDHQDLPSKLLK